MQEDAIAMTDEELNDSEIVMVANVSARELRQLNRDTQDQTNTVDTQLKALGLYEEGMSVEQKEELLAVVAASRKTAEQEESMRLRAKEWQQKIYPTEVELGTDSAETIDLSSPSVGSPKVESSMQLLHLDQNEESPSQELFDLADSESILPSKRPLDMSPKMESRPSAMQTKPVRRGRGRPSSSQSRLGLVTVHQTAPSNSYDDCLDHDIEDVVQVDFIRQKKDLEKSIPMWKPCSSPEGDALNSSRLPAVVDQNTPHKEHYQMFLNSIEEFYTCLDHHQRKSSVFLSWGQPITVGRAYATRSTRSRAVDTENSDSIYSFHPANEDPTNSGNNMCEYYTRLRQFNKNLEKSPGNSTSGNTVAISRKQSRSASKAMLQRYASSNMLKRTHDNENTNKDLAETARAQGGSDIGLCDDALEMQRESIFGARKTCQKTFSARIHQRSSFLDRDSENNPTAATSVQNSNVLRSSGNSETVDSRVENCNSSTRLMDGDMKTWDQENYIDVVEPRTLKRRKGSTIRSLNSPKRLKEAGTTS